MDTPIQRRRVIQAGIEHRGFNVMYLPPLLILSQSY
jgi:hypothetical protein